MGDDASMILMLDHITFATPAEKRRQTMEQFCGYSVRFSEDGLPNIAAKQPLFQRPHISHELIKLDSPAGYPIEVVVYDVCRGVSGISICQDKTEIWIPTQGTAGSIAFWKSLGFNMAENDPALLVAKGPLDRMPVKIRLLEVCSGQKAWLDQEGPVALAFIVTHHADLQKKLSQQGFAVSKADSLSVNGKALRISFAVSGYGDIAEIISVDGMR